MMTMLDILNTKKAASVSMAAQKPSSWELEPDGFIFLPLRKIDDNPYQPRSHYDAEHILNLAASIKAMKTEVPATRGLQQVPLARVIFRKGESTELAPRHFYGAGNITRIMETRTDAGVQLMFGHSRYRAFLVLSQGIAAHRRTHGLTLGLNWASVTEVETRFAELLDPDPDYAEMPIMLGFALDHAMWSHAITENSQRKNITAIEEAQSIERAMEEFGLSIEEAAKPFGYQRSTASNKVRLRRLPADVQKAISAGELSERHGRELLRVIDDPARVQKLADLAIKKSMSVRQLTENVDWEEKGLKADQEKARQVAAARSALANGWQTPMSETLTSSRVLDTQDWQAGAFDKNDVKDRMLIEQGVCSAQACECFAVVHSTYHHEQGYRPDPAKAPNMCLGCTNHNAKVDKRNALGKVTDGGVDARAKLVADAERKRKLEAMNNEAHMVWQRWLRDQDKHALWNSITFWQAAVNVGNWRLTEAIEKAPDVQTACNELLKALYLSTREYNSELGGQAHTVAGVKKLLKALGSVSRETEYDGIQEVFKGDDDARVSAKLVGGAALEGRL